jgi:hypothetical protein
MILKKLISSSMIEFFFWGGRVGGSNLQWSALGSKGAPTPTTPQVLSPHVGFTPAAACAQCVVWELILHHIAG